MSISVLPRCCISRQAAHPKSGKLFIYNQDAIGSGPMQVIMITPYDSQSGFIDGFIGDVAYDPVLNQIYVSSPQDDGVGTYFHGLIAFAPKPTARSRSSGSSRSASTTRPLCRHPR